MEIESFNFKYNNFLKLIEARQKFDKKDTESVYAKAARVWNTEIEQLMKKFWD